METTNQQIGKRLRKMRGLMGESQQELANAVNCSRGTVSKYERGLLALSPEQINNVCSRYNIAHRWLLTGVGAAQTTEIQESDLFALFTQLPPEAIKPLKQFINIFIKK